MSTLPVTSWAVCPAVWWGSVGGEDGESGVAFLNSGLCFLTWKTQTWSLVLTSLPADSAESYFPKFHFLACVVGMSIALNRVTQTK